MLEDHFLHAHTLDDMLFLGTTPANRADSPEYGGVQQSQFPANYQSLHDEQILEQTEVEEEERTTTRCVSVCVRLSGCICPCASGSECVCLYVSICISVC